MDFKVGLVKFVASRFFGYLKTFMKDDRLDDSDVQKKILDGSDRMENRDADFALLVITFFKYIVSEKGWDILKESMSQENLEFVVELFKEKLEVFK